MNDRVRRSIILLIFFFFILAPTLTFIHELGHSLLPLLRNETVIITIGGYEGPSVNLGRLSVIYVGPWMPWAGFTNWSGERDVFRLALGPLTSLAMAFLFFYLLRRTRNPNAAFLLRASIAWVVCAVLVTASPFKYPSFLLKNPTDKSDGLQIVELLRGD